MAGTSEWWCFAGLCCSSLNADTVRLPPDLDCGPFLYPRLPHDIDPRCTSLFYKKFSCIKQFLIFDSKFVWHITVQTAWNWACTDRNEMSGLSKCPARTISDVQGSCKCTANTFVLGDLDVYIVYRSVAFIPFNDDQFHFLNDLRNAIW